MTVRRGQAALEFLTTYGWAFLIIIVMVGAIAYFGILNPSKFLPDRCITSSEFSCEDHQVAGNKVLFQLKQGIGKTIFFEGASCSYEAQGNTYIKAATARVQTTGTPVLNAGDSWSPRNAVAFECDYASSGALLSGLQGEKVKVLYNLTYRKSSTGFTHTADGEIFSEVQ